MPTTINISPGEYRYTSSENQDFMAHDLSIGDELLSKTSLKPVPEKFKFRQGAMTFIPRDRVQFAIRKYFAGFHCKEVPMYDCRAFACDVLGVEYHLVDDTHKYVMFKKVSDIAQHQDGVI